MRTATITIDTAALHYNLAQVKRLAPKANVLAMVKADAYGHGIAHCLPALQEADAIGLACFDEAKQARLLGWAKKIVLIEGVFSETEWQQALSYECQCVIHHLPQVEWALAQPPDADSPSRTLWLKLNTGMNRLGFEPDEIVPIAKRLIEADYDLVLTSHFANADVPAHASNLQQIAAFNTVLSQLKQQVSPSIQASLCNSAGLINYPQYHFDWVRPGIMLYGSSPFNDISAAELNLQPVMTFSARLMAIQPLLKGACIGYGSRFTASKAMTKGIVSIGYGDGYPRVVDDNAWVGLHQDNITYRCPIIGRVAMDMIAIDISDVPNPVIGSTVTLWGNPVKGEPSVDEIALSANTIGYELLCRVTQRPTRHLW